MSLQETEDLALLRKLVKLEAVNVPAEDQEVYYEAMLEAWNEVPLAKRGEAREDLKMQVAELEILIQTAKGTE